MSKHTSNPTYTFADTESFRRLSWTWSTSVDTKNWALLKSVCADNVKLIYSGLSEHAPDETKTKEDYVENFVRAHLGDSRLHTQHLLGNVVFTMTGENLAKGEWQARARHLRDMNDGAVVEWSGGCYINHYYERDGTDKEWKFSGVEPHTVLWEVGKWGDVIGEFA